MTNSSNAAFEHIFQDLDQPLEARIDSLLALLTLEEKVICLGTDPSVPRLGLRGSGHIEGLHGVAMGEPGGWGGKEPVPTTTFPQSIGLGQTWDTELVGRAAAAEGYEARYLFQCESYRRGGIVVRAPNADLGRDPRWGRTEECYGEDAFFNGAMTAAFVHGLQGDHPTYWQAASLMKHFLANSNEDGRESSSSDFDERLFREYYSVPFRRGIEAGSRAYMAAYNSYNGIPCSVHPMLKEITVTEWGQDGIICTDGGAMKLLVSEHKAFSDQAQACAAIVKAGIGQFLDDHVAPTHEALETGLLTEAEVDAALRGNFRVMIRLGLWDPPEQVPYTKIGTGGELEPWLGDAHKALACEVTQKSIVLLKNEANLLPLDRSSLKSVAVIGPFADRVLLDWYSGTPPYAITPLQGLRSALGPGVEVHSSDGSDAEEAVSLARVADIVIVCVGNNPVGAGGWAKVNSPDEGREAVDRQSLTLGLGQEELIRSIQGANSKTVLVLISSFPYAINWAQEHVPAIVQMTHNSQEQGYALAAVLLGDFNPGGRLVQTWPASLDQLPPMMDYDIRHGRTYQYFQGQPLYPFGFGLSYTSFAYTNLQTSAEKVAGDGSVIVSIDITNTGEKAGDEVVQFYVYYLDSSVPRPVKQLVGFQRVNFLPGEKKTVTMEITATLLAFWDTAAQKFVVEEGQVQLLIGASSADIKQEKTIRVTH
jgi:beta-glucosidase